MQSLALNGIDCNEAASMNRDGDKPESSTSTLFDRIARWGTFLLSNNDNGGNHAGETRTENVTRNKSNTTHNRSGNDYNNFGGGVGIANRLNYLSQDSPAKKSIQTNTDQISVGMHSRMLLMSSAFRSNSPDAEATGEKRGLDPIGPLPHIESDVLPDIATFRLLINGES